MKYIKKFESIEISDIEDIKDIFQEYADELNLSYVTMDILKKRAMVKYGYGCSVLNYSHIKSLMDALEYYIGVGNPDKPTAGWRYYYKGNQQRMQSLDSKFIYIIISVDGVPSSEFLTTMESVISRLKHIGYGCDGETIQHNMFYKITITN